MNRNAAAYRASFGTRLLRDDEIAALAALREALTTGTEIPSVYKRRLRNFLEDDRCLNAHGKNMSCECACGGKNHGRGQFIAEAA